MRIGDRRRRARPRPARRLRRRRFRVERLAAGGAARQGAKELMAAYLDGKHLDYRWVACLRTGRRFEEASIVRCNVNFGDPHIEAYCIVLRDGQLYSDHQDPAIPCQRDNRAPPATIVDLLMRLENSFEVAAPLEQSWRAAQRRARASFRACPAPSWSRSSATNAWKAKLHVKLGPIALQFLADVVREQMDEAGRPGRARREGARGQGPGERRGDDRVDARRGGRRHAGRHRHRARAPRRRRPVRPRRRRRRRLAADRAVRRLHRPQARRPGASGVARARRRAPRRSAASGCCSARSGAPCSGDREGPA